MGSCQHALVALLLITCPCSCQSGVVGSPGADSSPDGPDLAIEPDTTVRHDTSRETLPPPPSIWRPQGPCLHAHNDYLHDRPLFDTLDHRACSVEADVFLVGSELRVAHELEQTQAGRTLESLYLEPLRQTVADHGGSVYGDGMQLVLLIDLKSEIAPTVPVHLLILQPRAPKASEARGFARPDGSCRRPTSARPSSSRATVRSGSLASSDGRRHVSHASSPTTQEPTNNGAIEHGCGLESTS